jgi:hypothetical protein
VLQFQPVPAARAQTGGGNLMETIQRGREG